MSPRFYLAGRVGPNMGQTIRRHLGLSGLSLIVVLGGIACPSSERESSKAGAVPPGPKGATNVLLITIDTLRADHLGTYGYPRDVSPNIDALAAQGRVLEAAYAIYPRTGPSVAALLMGAFPTKVHDWSIPPDAGTLAKILRSHGYRTAAAVDNANLSREHGYAQGFDSYRETWMESRSEIEKTRLISDTAIERVTAFQTGAAPFLIWLHYVNPHGPYDPPAKYTQPFMSDRYFDPDTIVPLRPFAPGDDAFVRSERRLGVYIANYDGEIAFVDAEIGRVIDFLKRQPAFKNTLVVITADHGESLGEWRLYFMHGPKLNEANLQVPLIFFHAGQIARARILAPVLLTDVVPTILDWVGLPLTTESESPLAGESLVALSARDNESPHPYLFFASNEYWGIRRGYFKVIMQAVDKVVYQGPRYQAFDLEKDPAEIDDIFEEQRPRAESLMKVLGRRRAIQNEIVDRASVRHNDLSKEALENLRALGYIQ